MTKSEITENARSPFFWTAFFLVLPILVHTGLVIWSVTQAENHIYFGRLDLVWFIAVVGYLCIGVFLIQRKAWAARFLLVSYASLLTLAAVELVLSLVVPAQPVGMPWAPQHRIVSVGEGHPGLASPVEFSVNTLGLRGPEVQLREMDLRILCIGGSTTECLMVSDKLTWPWRLQDQLAEKLKKKVFVGNAGRASMFALHHDYVLANYDKTHLFDWVVVLCGINDMGVHMNRQNYDIRSPNVPEETMMTPSNESVIYYRRLALVRIASRMRMLWGTSTVVQDDRGDWLVEQRRVRKGAMQKQIEIPRELLEKALAIYQRDLENIIVTCKFKRVKLVMMTQPTIWCKDLSKDLQDLIYINSGQHIFGLAALEEMMQAFNDTMVRVCGERGIDCIDLASQLPKDTSVFYDDAHFNIPGCEKVANVVSEFFLAKYAPK
jgi:hypothetical protein